MFELEFYPSIEYFEQVGITVFGQAELLWPIALPEGWRWKKLADAVSCILDDRNRVRASMLLETDRTVDVKLAKLFLYTNYSISYNCDNGKIRVFVRNGEGECIRYIGICEKSAEKFDEYWSEAIAWLDENYPDWKDPTKYWD